MANWLALLLSKSPYGPLLDHQRKVQEVAHVVPELVEAALRGNGPRLKELAKQASVLEYEADHIKNTVRDNTPRSLLMPVSRADLLAVLAAQDAVADCSEDVGVLLTMRAMEPLPDDVAALLRELVSAALSVVDRATEVVEKLHGVMSAAFAGEETRQLIRLIDQVDREEHLADKIQDQLAKAFFRHETNFAAGGIYTWNKVFSKVGDLANCSERMTHRIRLFLAD